MFREMRRWKQALPKEKCEEILTGERRAALSVTGDDGYPYAIPINFYYDAEKSQIYFHCAKEGHKIDAINNCDKVCITTWTAGEPVENDWSFYVDSVIVMGRAHLISDEEHKIEVARKFAYKYYPTEEEADIEIEKDGARVQMVEIEIEHMSGKHVHEK